MASIPPNWNLINNYDQLRYKCGLAAGDVVRLRKDVVVKFADGGSTGEIYTQGELWTVLKGTLSDPTAVWFRRPNGERATWSDDLELYEWFEKVQKGGRKKGDVAH